jgi:hypothetical protein
MAWLITDPILAAQIAAANASTRWHIIAGESIVINPRSEMALHGELLLHS